MVAFVTLCEAYMGIETYFFHARLQQSSGAKAATLGNVDLFVISGHGANPYFHLPMSNPLDGQRKVWFFLRNNADMLLPVFMGRHPISQPKWGYDVAQRDLRRLQPLRDVI
jgi:hypothetical protein